MTPLKTHYFHLLAKQKKMALLGIFLAVLTAFSGIALLAVSGWFISAAALAGALSALAALEFNFFTPGAMVRGFSISRTLGRYGERLTSHEATFRIISHLRADLFRFIARRPWTETQLNRHESASRLMQDIQYIESIYLSALLPAAVSLAVVLGYLLTLALVLPQTLLWALLPLLLAVILMPALYSRQVLRAQDNVHQIRSAQWRVSSSLLSNIRTLALHRRLQPAGKQLTDIARQGDEQENASVDKQQGILLLAQICLIAMTLLVFWQGFVAYAAGQLAGANVFMLLLLSLGAGEVLITASPVLASYRLGMQALDRLQAIDPDTDPSEAHRDTRIFHTAESPMAELENLTYRYPAQPEAVFSDFSYQFSGADGGTGWHWICGASGRGKSTLIALLSGQLQPGSGRIILSLADSSRLALMPQRIDILKASLRDNLCLNRQHSDEAIRAALALVELGQWAENLPQGLDTWLGDGEWQPSGGESKRIGLARVILMEPQIILLDEPAAGMDAALAQRIFAGLAEHWQDKLVIANTHDRGLILSGQKVLELDAT
ncbi:MAG: hypothetical protein CMI02_07135 [Oceanospirillaceae bacterium]|nr:hypothetical protein [Oceanospirillaceae bacterium]MBT11790.1 hypothetical protein [Oceanospirillaceae bacterium]|tara:strand:- start:39179 stop:40828 length:1650 start_codon:yes stop_codon:yes gene_type:complete